MNVEKVRMGIMTAATKMATRAIIVRGFLDPSLLSVTTSMSEAAYLSAEIYEGLNA
jgi:hypothetical protein